MANSIVPSEITGGSVYGVRQVQYTVDGASGKDFVDAVTTAAFKQATAIETAASGYAAVVRARQVKVSELGQVLAYIAKALGSLKSNGKSDDKATIDNAQWVKTTAAKYGISLSFTDGNKMTRENVMKAQTNVQYEIDKEDNSLQQDIVTLQSYMTKRDNALSNAAKVVKKANNAAQATIRNIE